MGKKDCSWRINKLRLFGLLILLVAFAAIALGLYFYYQEGSRSSNNWPSIVYYTFTMILSLSSLIIIIVNWSKRKFISVSKCRKALGGMRNDLFYLTARSNSVVLFGSENARKMLEYCKPNDIHPRNGIILTDRMVVSSSASVKGRIGFSSKFRIEIDDMTPYSNIIIIDDINITGNTMNAIIKLLLEQGIAPGNIFIEFLVSDIDASLSYPSVFVKHKMSIDFDGKSYSFPWRTMN